MVQHFSALVVPCLAPTSKGKVGAQYALGSTYKCPRVQIQYTLATPCLLVSSPPPFVSIGYISYTCFISPTPSSLCILYHTLVFVFALCLYHGSPCMCPLLSLVCRNWIESVRRRRDRTHCSRDASFQCRSYHHGYSRMMTRCDQLVLAL